MVKRQGLNYGADSADAPLPERAAKPRNADAAPAWPHFGQRCLWQARQYARPQPAHGASPVSATSG